MKIDPLQQTPAKAPVKPAVNQPQLERGATFGQVLNQTVEQQARPVCGSTPTMAAQRPSIAADGPPNLHRESAAQVKASLDALEAYRSALIDPQATLRDMTPLMASLEAAHQTLGETLSHLPKEDPLRQIGEQARSLIVAERARFDSGIYT
ncbi:MAG: hypothetical protein P8010_12920 [Desulfosarcinaceae bacterium]